MKTRVSRVKLLAGLKEMWRVLAALVLLLVFTLNMHHAEVPSINSTSNTMAVIIPATYADLESGVLLETMASIRNQTDGDWI